MGLKELEGSLAAQAGCQPAAASKTAKFKTGEMGTGTNFATAAKFKPVPISRFSTRRRFPTCRT
jgi:hypothetical protein